MSELLLHTRTKDEIDAFLANASHALLLVGLKGSGKASVATYIASRILGISNEKLENYQYYYHLKPQNGTIGVSEMRSVKKFLQLRTTGNGKIRRVIIVEDFHCATIEAQNAILKTLEEPPSDTVLLLTAVQSSAVLETIYSRVQQIEVKNPTHAQILEFFKEDFEATRLQEAINLSSGFMGHLCAILQGGEVVQLGAEHIASAKQLLGQDIYQRLIVATSTLADRAYFNETLTVLSQMASVSISRAAQAEKTKDVRRWFRVLQEVKRAQQRLDHSVNQKLVVTDLLLNM